MIDRLRVQIDSHLASAKIRKLIDVGFQSKTEAFCGFEQTSRLIQIERAFLAEDVTEKRDPSVKRGSDIPAPGKLQHVAADQVDVRVCVVLELGRYGVGCEECRDDVDRVRIVRSRYRFEHLQFCSGVEAVAGFDLAGGRSGRQHIVETRSSLRDELFDRGTAGVSNRGNNSAAARQNIQIIRALYLELELIQPVTGEDDVCVRVNKARTNSASAGVDGFGGFMRPHYFVGASRREYLARGNRDCGVFDHPNVEHIRAAFRFPGGRTCYELSNI